MVMYCIELSLFVIYDFIIMNNRVVFDKKKDSKKIETCFQKFEGEDIIQIKARDLVISKITKKK